MQATLERLRLRREELGDEGGFTLIELLIVIVILGILAAIVVFAVQNLTGTSSQGSCQSDVQTVDHAVQAYYAENSSAFPTNVSQLTAANGLLHNTPQNGEHYLIELDTNIVAATAPAVGFVQGANAAGTKGQVDVLAGGNGAAPDVWTSKTTFNPTATGAAAAACTNVK